MLDLLFSYNTFMDDIKQKTIRFESTELDIIRYFANYWGLKHSVVVRRILREFKDLKNVEIGG